MNPQDPVPPSPSLGQEGLLGAYFEASDQALAVMGADGMVHWANGMARRLLGLDPPQAWTGVLLGEEGQPLAVHPALEPIREQRSLAPLQVGVAGPDGEPRWVELSVTPLRRGLGMVSCQDLQERLRLEAVLEARTRLAALAPTLDMEALLRATLDEAERLTGSCIGFLHFLEADQARLHLQAWSTRTEAQFCRAEGKGRHYGVDQAGVWADCIRERRPIIHNDYAALPHRKGLPPGHAHVLREAVVPVLREGAIVAILGVGNRSTPYRPSDLATLQVLADLAWDLAVARREQARRRQRDLDHLELLSQLPGAVYRRSWDGHLSFCSEGLVRLTGCAREALLDGVYSLLDLIHPEDRAGVGQGLEAASAGGRGFDLRYRLVTSEEQVRWVRDTGRVHVDPGGGAGWVEGVLMDITAEHQVEAVLEVQRDELEALFQTSPDLLVLASLEGVFLRLNPQWERVLGYATERLEGCRFQDFVHPEDQASTQAALTRLAAGEELLGFENRYRAADGTYRWLAWRATPRGHLAYAAARDITEQRQMEEARHFSEQRARTMLRTAMDGVWLMDGQGCFLDANEAALAMLGTTREALIGGHVSLVEAAEDPETTARHIARLRAQGWDRFETRHRRADGTVFPVEVSVTWLEDEAQMVVFVHDITEREAARQEHARYEDLVQTVEGVVWEADARTLRFTFVSRQAERLLGHPLEAWLEPGFWEDHLHPEDREATVATCLETTARGVNHVMEYRFLAADGRAVWLRDLATVVMEEGRPRWLRGLMMDITLLKGSEEAIRRSEGRFRSLFEAAATPILVSDLAGRIEGLNRHFRQIFGYGQEVLGDLEAWWPLAFPDPFYRIQVRQLWEEAFRRALESDGEIHPAQTFEVTCGDGAVRSVDIRGALTVDRMILVFHDLTERIQGARALEDSEARFRSLFEHATLGIYRATPEGAILLANPSLVRMLGLRPGEPLAWPIRATGEGARPQLWQRLLQAGTLRGVESTWRTAAGREVHVRESAWVVQGADGRPLCLEGTVEDITDWREAEEALRLRTEELLASRQIFAAIFRQNLAAMALSTWPEGRLEDVNPAWEALLLLDRSEVLGQTADSLGIFPDAREVGEILERLSTRGVVDGFEMAVRDRSGRIHQVLWSGQVTRIGGEDFLVSSAVDISTQHQTLESLRASEARNRALVSALPDLVFVLSASGRFLDCHGSEQALLLPPERFLDRNVTEVFPGDLGTRCLARVKEVLGDGQPGLLEYDLALNGRTRSFEARMVAMGVDRVLVLAREVTDRVEARLALEESQARLAQSQKMESLGALAGGVAHDMNNVLGAILALSTSHRDRVEGPLAKALDTITTACLRGRTTVQRLLGFARQELTETRPVDLNALVQETCGLLERTTFGRVDLVLDLAPGLPELQGDPAALGHVLMNLCVNALDAMPDGGTLRLSTARRAEWLRLTVADSGCGMSAEAVARAFDPFFTTKPPGQGTGLGLPMVYGTVKAHQGEVWIESRPGEGTQVLVELPARTSRAAAVGPLDAEVVDGGTVSRSLLVLLVDDDELVRESLAALLGILAFRVEEARRGEEALDRLREGLRPDVVIMDVNMPGLGAEGTLPILRALCPELPVLLATGRLDERVESLARTWHADLLGKPFSLEELQTHLRRLCPD